MNADADLHSNVVLELAFGWPFPAEHGMVAQPFKSTRVAPRSKSDPVLRRQHVPMSSAEVRRGTPSSLLIRVGGLSSIGKGWKQEQRPWHWMAQLSGTYIRRRGILMRQTGGTPQDYAVLQFAPCLPGLVLLKRVQFCSTKLAFDVVFSYSRLQRRSL